MIAPRMAHNAGSRSDRRSALHWPRPALALSTSGRRYIQLHQRRRAHEHRATNTVLLLANGAAGWSRRWQASRSPRFKPLCTKCAPELSRAIPADGEGATHLKSIEVTGCASRAAARQIARTVADSPLVKTAIAGADPNWGRIVSAAGYAGVPFDPEGVELHLNGTLVFSRGKPTQFDADAVSASIRDQRETSISLKFSEGDGRCEFLTTDLTAEYVRLNAHYHT